MASNIAVCELDEMHNFHHDGKLVILNTCNFFKSKSIKYCDNSGQSLDNAFEFKKIETKKKILKLLQCVSNIWNEKVFKCKSSSFVFEKVCKK